MEDRKGNKLVILAIILLIILLIFILKSGAENILQINYKGELKLYCNDTKCVTTPEDNYNNVIIIKTESENPKYYDADTIVNNDETKLLYILYEDNNKIKIYNIDTLKIEETELENTYSNYEFAFKNGNEIGGITYNINSNSVGYYSYELKIKLYEGEYSSITQLTSNYLTGNTYDENGSHSYLIDSTKEKVYLNKNDECSTYSILGTQEKNFIIDQNNCTGISGDIIIYTKGLTELASLDSESEYSINDNGNINILKNNKVYTYDSTGKLINTSQEYNDIKQLIKNYIVYVENNYLYITDGNTKSAICDYSKVSYYNVASSGYYKKNERGTNKDEGIYIFLTLESGTTMEYYYNIIGKGIRSSIVDNEIDFE